MREYFYGYGYRETKAWTCPNCHNYHTCGMDLTVDENARKHQETCHPTPQSIPQPKNKLKIELQLPKMDGYEIHPGVVLIGEPTPVPGTDKLRCLANVYGSLCRVELSIKFLEKV